MCCEAGNAACEGGYASQNYHIAALLPPKSRSCLTCLVPGSTFGRMNLRTPLLIVLSSLTAAPIRSADEGLDLARHFEAVSAQGSFVLFDSAGGTYLRYNPERARQRFLPASTFKILNSLIALETGVVDDEHVVFPWDGSDRGRESWNRDHDLASAFADSAFWYYQEIARRIGEARMRRFVSLVGYGNRKIGGGIDRFWLDGELRISADEQVELLRRLEKSDLPFSERAMATVRRMMKIEEGEGYVLRGKTGWSVEGGNHGWYVGWVERADGPRIFALELSSSEPDFPMYRVRQELLEGILTELGVVALLVP